MGSVLSKHEKHVPVDPLLLEVSDVMSTSLDLDTTLRRVAEVVRKWEPRAFSDRIELAVGADLQYIRMNGTIVGGLVGGGLYLLSLLAH